MAGSLYLGSQKVCPAIVIGGGATTTDVTTLKLPDYLKNIEDGNFQITCNIIDKTGEEDVYIPLKLDFNNVEKITGYYWAVNYFKIQKKNIAVDFGKIKEIGDSSGDNNGTFGSAFRAVSFIQGYTDISFDNLETLGNYAFEATFQSSNITALRFKKLKNMSADAVGYMLFGCKDVDVYFYAVDSSTNLSGGGFSDICYMAKNVTLHLPSNMSAIIPTITGYPNFGGTNTIILYDLPATE